MTDIPIPADFAEAAARMADHSLCRHYRRGARIVAAWRAAVGVAPPVYKHPRAMDVPADFAERAPKMTITQLVEHYRVSDNPVRRWLRLTGIVPKVGIWRPKVRHPAPFAAGVVDTSTAGRAAQFLRRCGPVYRASVLPAAERKARKAEVSDFILFGRVVSPNELLAQAEKRGFDPREWAAVPSTHLQTEKELAQ